MGRFFMTGLLFISLLGCKDKEKSILFDEDLGQFDVKFKEFVPTVQQVLVDSVKMDIPSTIKAGVINDFEYGVVRRNHFTEYYTNEGVEVDPASTYISTTLRLEVDFNFYEGVKANSSHTIEIFELTDSINNENNQYYNYSTVAYNPVPIGTHTFDAKILEYEDNIAATDVRDSIDIVIDDAFGMKLFEKAQDPTYFTNPSGGKRRREFPGLLIKIDGANILSFKKDGYTELILNTITADDEPTDFSYGFGLNSNVSFQNIEHDKTGTALENLNNFYEPSPLTDGLAYAQSSTGFMPMLDISAIKEGFKDVSSYKLNSAIIEFDLIVDNDNFEIIKAPEYIGLSACLENGQYDYNYRTRIIATNGDIAKDQVSKKFIFKDVNPNEPNLVSIQETEEGTEVWTYRANITFFIQFLLDDTVDFKDLILMPVSVSQTDLIYRIDNFERFRLDPNNVKVKVFYTQAKVQ